MNFQNGIQLGDQKLGRSGQTPCKTRPLGALSGLNFVADYTFA
jgi:hypothetical protein